MIKKMHADYRKDVCERERRKGQTDREGECIYIYIYVCAYMLYGSKASLPSLGHPQFDL